MLNWLELILVTILLLGGSITAWFLRRRIRAFWVSVKERLKPFFQGSTFFRLGETFMNEAAVLWFVFPLLNVLYPETTNNPHPPGWFSILGTILLSWGIAGFLFAIGLVFGSFAEKKHLESQG